ncbi:class I SAM-dependent methyltransferase [Phosphitispora fastidiosa]|uniref:class I SAM-dependent methyltransferase n=1 Tax=Phosphitispora fastidiosa TaxID=2837202 RepID=UPI001E58B791|nr:class I SAM-dependent methyltransferase [Phosphitispora fastidiosa]MBU7008565.1 2-polyprenyl-3-methyl-5-hydroxy-6-metoxy-1 [Phosphitispora fastidiosa]
MKKRACRFCDTRLNISFVDLGMSPLSNAYLPPEKLQEKENFYPLHAYVCEKCFLVQLEEFETPEQIFGDYAYFSSYSESWLKHARDYTKHMISRFALSAQHQVVEIASNDGYLLQYFKAAGIPIMGIEPAANVAKAAQQKGIPTIVAFFGQQTARALAGEGKQADLLIGNNVLAHVPDLLDFVSGMKILLKPQGIITMEFPHLLRLIQENQFDTIYHEHFSYFSLTTVNKVFTAQGLTLFDVEELPTHGGSLRIYARHTEDRTKPVDLRVTKLLTREETAGIRQIRTYQTFGEQVKETKRKILKFLIRFKEEGRTIVGYGAPAKGNTLLNYCGIGTDFLDYTADRSPFKQGLYLPGTHIPVESPDKIRETKPDYVIILPWNLKDEVAEQMAYIREWGGKFIVLIPKVTVI